MKLNKWITFASAAAMLAGVGACNSNSGGRTSTTSSAPEGRRGTNLPRSTGMDAGADVNTRSGGNIGGSTSGSSDSSGASGTAGSSGSSTSSPGSSSGSATGSSGSSGSPSGSSNPR